MKIREHYKNELESRGLKVPHQVQVSGSGPAFLEELQVMRSASRAAKPDVMLLRA